jgi:nicotinamide-nucleotide amidase
MQAEFIRRCSVCLLNEKEVAPFIQELKKMYPQVEMALFPSSGTVQIMFQSTEPVYELVEEVQKKFPSFFYGEGRIEEAVHREFIARNKTLALAESCSGGALAAKLTAIPDASKFLLGSIVAYSNGWKEHFLQVSRTTLKKKGAASKEAVIEMVQGLFHETEADFAVAVSGIAGPGGGTSEKPVGTIYIAIGQRGQKIDAGVIQAPTERQSAIDLSVHLTLGALWRRLVHNTATFS